MTDDARRYAPSAARNRDVILKTLSPHLPERGHVLEVASGSGEHITLIAAAHPTLTFQPSEVDPVGRASVDAWARHLDLQNVLPAIALDMTQTISAGLKADVMICINMIHIAPWSATIGLMRNAGAILPTGGLLFLYGPYRQHYAHTAESNAAFDADLRSRNAEWGVRDMEAVTALADSHGLAAPLIEVMPANNVSLLFRRR